MVPYNPQQNGRVERLHGIHIRNADAMLTVCQTTPQILGRCRCYR